MPRAGKKAIARYVSHSNNGVLQEKETMPKKNILIGDDDQVILDILKEMIQREGYRVFLASNGKEAVETIKVNPIDLAILDIKMPFMDGIEALK
jgi:CheY-like chemotaxis protein